MNVLPLAMDTSLLLGLLGLFIITFVGNGVIPLPITAVIVWMGQFHQPVWVVIIAMLGTMLGWWLMQHYLVQLVEKRPSLATRLPPGLQKAMLRHTALWAFIFNALPLASDPIRLIAVANQYDPKKLFVCIGLGRIVRYTLLVVAGSWLSQYQMLFNVILAALVIVPFVLSAMKSKRETPEL